MPDSWFSFLEKRKVVIDEFLAEGKTCTEVAAILSMEPGQVWLISDRSKEEPAPVDAAQAIQSHINRVFGSVMEMEQAETDAEYTKALQDCIALFEAWRDGIFAKIGVTWMEEPPAIQKARAILADQDS